MKTTFRFKMAAIIGLGVAMMAAAAFGSKAADRDPAWEAVTADPSHYVSIWGGAQIFDQASIDQNFIARNGAGAPVLAGGQVQNFIATLKDAPLGFRIGAAYGIPLGKIIRLEAEASVGRVQLDDSVTIDPGPGVAQLIDIDQGIWTPAIMGNVIVAVPMGSWFEPYIGGGAGPVWIRTDGETETALAYQIMAGSHFRLTDHTSLKVGYRYWATGSFDVDGVDVDSGLESHVIEAGLRFNF